jgi:chromate transport protein ChrA
MNQQPAKPSPRKLPWEIGVLRLLGSLAFIVAGMLVLGGLLAGAGSVKGEPNLPVILWSVPVAVVGLIFRAIAGAWSALERLASHFEL